METIKPPCAFCRIIEADNPKIINAFSNSRVVVFEPLNPVTPGHLLVVPREHVTDFADNPDEAAAAVRQAAWIVRTLGGEFNLITSKGPAATQTIFHLHVHLVPRHAGDGLLLPWEHREVVGCYHTNVYGVCRSCGARPVAY